MTLSLRNIFHRCLEKTRRHSGLGQLSASRATLIEDLEERLLLADTGLVTTDHLLAAVKRSNADPHATLKRNMLQILRTDRPEIDFAQRPQVFLIAGVNGAGKTTSIGKLSWQLQKSGRRVLLAAGDTFRAAAFEQLQKWAHISGADLYANDATRDAAAIAYEALDRAQRCGYDALIIDTAGRQHNQKRLMHELEKIARVLGRKNASWPQHRWLVIDAGNGQNGLHQATMFHKSLALNGLIVTRLDGTAKGGAILAIAHSTGMPIYYVGTGETVEDWQLFEPEPFVSALLEVQ